MGLSEEIVEFVMYIDMTDVLPAIVTVCQMQDTQIGQEQTENAAQSTGGGIGFAA
jgi:hypothetical protein